MNSLRFQWVEKYRIRFRRRRRFVPGGSRPGIRSLRNGRSETFFPHSREGNRARRATCWALRDGNLWRKTARSVCRAGVGTRNRIHRRMLLMRPKSPLASSAHQPPEISRPLVSRLSFLRFFAAITFAYLFFGCSIPSTYACDDRATKLNDRSCERYV